MKVLKLLFPILFIIQLQVVAQEISAEMRQREKQQFLSLTDTLKLRKLSNEFASKSRNDLNQARKFAKENGIPLVSNLPNGKTMLLQGVKDGRPIHDLAEMANAYMTDPRVYLSNHSYGIEAGWTSLGNGKWLWETDDSHYIDSAFKKYDGTALKLDSLVQTALLYTVVWAAGNARGQGPDNLQNCYYYLKGKLTTCTILHPKNGATDKSRNRRYL